MRMHCATGVLVTASASHTSLVSKSEANGRVSAATVMLSAMQEHRQVNIFHVSVWHSTLLVDHFNLISATFFILRFF